MTEARRADPATRHPTPSARRAHWRSWLDRWDAQQTGYIPDRERLFALMLDVVEAFVGDSPVVVDLASGPGSISQRVLARLPGARSVAVDVDPALLHVGRQALADQDERLTWVQADLRDPDWLDHLGVTQVDAVLSATATHWLHPDDLGALYRDLRTVLRPGGVYLNADSLPDPVDDSPLATALADSPLAAALAAAGDRHPASTSAAGDSDDGDAESWQDWWDALATEPDLTDDLAGRDHIGSGHAHVPTVADHTAALREAGFADVGTLRDGSTTRILAAC